MFDIFDKSQKENKADSTKEVVTIDKEKILEQIKKATVKSSIELTPHKAHDLSLFTSKFGGQPYLPKEQEVPLDKQGKKMMLLAQIRCEELPENEVYPKQGLMQFWIGLDDVMGMDMSDLTSNKNSKVIYYPTVDESVTKEEIAKKYALTISEEEELNMVFDNKDAQYSLTFNKVEQYISIGDRDFDALFVDIYNRIYPYAPINSFWEVSDDVWNSLAGVLCVEKSRIGGWPEFTQGDPRDDDTKNYTVLLLQIASIYDKKNDIDIMWGDCGIANFFVTKEQLENLDFSKALYTWDCC